MLSKKAGDFTSCKVTAVSDVQMCELGSVADRVESFVSYAGMVKVKDFEARETRQKKLKICGFDCEALVEAEVFNLQLESWFEG